VDVEQAGQHPLAGRVDHLRAARLVEVVRRDRHDVAVADSKVADRGRGAGAVEPAAVADDRVIAHQVIEQSAIASVNEIGEQI
jgi:hypothetical protein